MYWLYSVACPADFLASDSSVKSDGKSKEGSCVVWKCASGKGAAKLVISLHLTVHISSERFSTT